MKLKLQKYRQFFLPLMLMCVVLGVYFQLNGGIPVPTNAQTGTTVTFGSVGDSGGSSNSSAVLNSVKSANLNFFLHVGDFSYDSQGGPSGWPTWVKGIIGTVLPFEIVTGNHDDCCIATYVKGLPNKMTNINGTYGQNYYFDYPQTAPLMRVIMISPGLFAPNTSWLTTAIDSARTAKIPWVVVGTHLNCISTGAKSCQMTTGTFNLLLSKKVDLILQGHDHNYQRTKQLRCAKTGTTDQTCIVNAGPAYTKGAGSILVINGAGGNGFYAPSASDSEAGYFAKIDGKTYGFTKFTVTASQITGQFVKAAGSGTNADTFTIRGPVVPSPTTPPSSSPTPKPSIVVTAIPTPSTIVPTFVCIGGVPCITTSPTPIGTSPSPTSGGPIPTAGGPTNPVPSNSVSVPPIISQPCNNGVATIQAERKKHRKNSGSNGATGFLQQFIEFLMRLFELLLKLFGITLPGPGPSPTPGPSTVPSPEPTLVPSAAPSPTATPC